MKKILIRILTIAVVLTVTAGATRAYFSDLEGTNKNTYAAGVLDFTLSKVSGSWTFPFNNLQRGQSTGIQKLKLLLTNESMQAQHLEIRVTTHNFLDGIAGTNTADQFKKQIEIKQMYLEDINRNVVPNDWQRVETINKINDSKDGKTGFRSLYDLERSGVLDDIDIKQKEVEFRIELGLPADLPDTDDNKYQGDSIKVDFEFGMAQEDGQKVLND